jgi:hypothetical protein
MRESGGAEYDHGKRGQEWKQAFARRTLPPCPESQRDDEGEHAHRREHRMAGEPDFAARVSKLFAEDWQTLNEDWQVFVANLDYGYDFGRMQGARTKVRGVR